LLSNGFLVLCATHPNICQYPLLNYLYLHSLAANVISSSKQSQRFNLNCSSGKNCMSNFMTFLMIISCDFGIMCMSHKHQPPVFSTVLAPPPKVYIKLQMSCRESQYFETWKNYVKVECMSHKQQPPVFITVLAPPPKFYIKLQMNCTISPCNTKFPLTVFPQIVSAETILFWKWKLWKFSYSVRITHWEELPQSVSNFIFRLIISKHCGRTPRGVKGVKRSKIYWGIQKHSLPGRPSTHHWVKSKTIIEKHQKLKKRIINQLLVNFLPPKNIF
jgi:hypothetical protein